MSDSSDDKNGELVPLTAHRKKRLELQDTPGELQAIITNGTIKLSNGGVGKVTGVIMAISYDIEGGDRSDTGVRTISCDSVTRADWAMLLAIAVRRLAEPPVRSPRKKAP